MNKMEGQMNIPPMEAGAEKDINNLPIFETDETISYLGVKLEKAKNRSGQFVPNREQYRDYINDSEIALPAQRDIAVSLLNGDPILLEGGTSLGKTTTVRKMCAELGYEVHYANLNGATDVEDLMGRYIPNPHKTRPEDPEYIFADGKVTSGLRQEKGKIKVIIVDEYNASAPNILIRLHEVLDALERGGEVILSEDASEAVKVDKTKTKIIALMNPPGKGYLGREPLDPAQLRRWVYKKMPSELPDETFSFATQTLFGSKLEPGAIDSQMFLRERDFVLTTEELQEIPGSSEILQKYMEFHRDIKKFLKGNLEKGKFKSKRLAEDQPQLFTFDDRMEPRRVRDFVLRFYDGDLTGTFQQALRYYYSNKLESDLDKAFAEELIKLVEFKPEEDGRRKNADRESKKKKEEKERLEREKKEAEEKVKAKAEVDKTKTESEKAEGSLEEIKKKELELKKALRKAKREASGETFDPVISAEYKYKDEKGKEVKENIEIDFDKKLALTIKFCKNHKIKVSKDFETQMSDIWERNRNEMQEQIEKFGFDEILIIPATIKLDDALDQEMTMGYKKKDGTSGGPIYWGVEKKDIVSFRSSKNRIIMVHKNKARNLYDTADTLPILKKTLGEKVGSFKPEECLTIEEYLVFQRLFYEETGENLDEKGGTWLSSRAGSNVVRAFWSPDYAQVFVNANSPDYANVLIGCRLSRCFE